MVNTKILCWAAFKVLQFLLYLESVFIKFNSGYFCLLQETQYRWQGEECLTII